MKKLTYLNAVVLLALSTIVSAANYELDNSDRSVCLGDNCAPYIIELPDIDNSCYKNTKYVEYVSDDTENNCGYKHVSFMFLNEIRKNYCFIVAASNSQNIYTSKELVKNMGCK